MVTVRGDYLNENWPAMNSYVQRDVQLGLW